MNQTPNYQLNQWEKTDQIRMEDFNADNTKIEAALREIKTDLATVELSGLKLAIGTYVGNDSTSTPTSVSVGFAPKIVFVWANLCGQSSNYDANYFGMAIQGHSLCGILTLTDSGFQVLNLKSGSYPVYPALNSKHTYSYFALG